MTNYQKFVQQILIFKRKVKLFFGIEKNYDDEKLLKYLQETPSNDAQSFDYYTTELLYDFQLIEAQIKYIENGLNIYPCISKNCKRKVKNMLLSLEKEYCITRNALYESF